MPWVRPDRERPCRRIREVPSTLDWSAAIWSATAARCSRWTRASSRARSAQSSGLAIPRTTKQQTSTCRRFSNGETRTRTGDTTIFSRATLAADSSRFAGNSRASSAVSRVRIFPDFALVSQALRPTVGLVGLFVAPRGEAANNIDVEDRAQLVEQTRRRSECWALGRRCRWVIRREVATALLSKRAWTPTTFHARAGAVRP